MKLTVSKLYCIGVFFALCCATPENSWGGGGKSGHFKRTHIDTVDSIVHHAYNSVRGSSSQKRRVFTANRQIRGVESLSSTKVWISPPDVNIYATYSIPLHKGSARKQSDQINNSVAPSVDPVIPINNPIIPAIDPIVPLNNSAAPSVPINNTVVPANDLVIPSNNPVVQVNDPLVSAIEVSPSTPQSAYDMRFQHLLTVSVAQVLEKCKLRPLIKWPNDVLVNGKKVCGVSGCKYSKDDNVVNESEGQDDFFMANICLNVNMGNDICDLIDKPATSMALEGGQDFDRDEVLHMISETLFQNIENLQRAGFESTFMSYLKSHLIKFGMDTDVVSTFESPFFPEAFRGIFKDINEDGDLVLTVDGMDRVVKAAHIDPSISSRVMGLWKGITRHRELKNQQVEKSQLYPLPISRPSPPTELPPVLWHLEAIGDTSVEINPFFEKTRMIDLLLRKLEHDPHFNQLAFSIRKGIHSDGWGYLWKSDNGFFGVSVRKGEAFSPYSELQESHIKIFAYNRVVDKFGNLRKIQEVRENEQFCRNSYIPLFEWLRWSLWFASSGPVPIDELNLFLLEPVADVQQIQTEAYPIDSQQPKPLITPLLEGDVGFKDQGVQIPTENKPQTEALPEHRDQVLVLSTPAYEQDDQNFILVLEAHEKEEALKKFDKIYGKKIIKVMTESDHVRIHTELEGGMEKANETFEEITGRELNPLNGTDIERTKDFTFWFRESGKSGHPKLEVTNKKRKTYEKITFK